jgi:hypothetical protein
VPVNFNPKPTRGATFWAQLRQKQRVQNMIEDAKPFLQGRLEYQMSKIGIQTEDQTTKQMARFISEQYFYVTKGGREILLKEGRFGAMVETNWDGVQQDLALRFGVGVAYKSKLFSYLGNGDPRAKPLVLHIANQEYKPNQPRLYQKKGDLVLNRWSVPEVSYKEDIECNEEDLAPWLEMLERMFPKEEQRKYFEEWIAMTIVKPEINIAVCPLLRSDAGTGKDFLANEIFSPLVGEANFKNGNFEQITATHAEEIRYSTLVVINELYHGKTKKSADKLKAIVSDPTQQINPKMMTPFRMDVCTSYIIYSNSDNPLFLEDGDRRYWVPQRLKHKVDVYETADFLNDVLYPWLKTGGLHKIRARLQRISEGLPDNHFKAAPVTPEKEQITHLDMKPSHKERFSEELARFHGTQLSLSDVLEWDTVKGRLNQSDVRQLLKEGGFVNKRRNGVMKWIYDRPSMEPARVVAVNSGCEF